MSAPPSSAPPSSVSSSFPSSPALPPPAPKILLAKPGSVGQSGGKFPREDDPVVLRSRAPSAISSLSLLSSDSWEFHTDRALPFLTENTDFTVIGIIGPPGVGKSTVLNELYGYDASSPGMLPPFTAQSEETRAMAKHCSTGIEMRVSAERMILLDTQPVYSPSVLAEMMRPDGSSTLPVLAGETLSADLAHELMGIQLGIFLCSICHILVVVSEGVHDTDMWHLMLTVDLLKHNIPDPSLLTSYNHNSNIEVDIEGKDSNLFSGKEFLASPIFLHNRLGDQEFSPSSVALLRRSLQQYFKMTSFSENKKRELASFTGSHNDTSNICAPEMDLFLLPYKIQDDSHRPQYGSYNCMIGKLRNEVLSMKPRTFAKPVSERDWVRNSAKIWDMVKKSVIVADYCKTLQSSGLFRK